jgi:hypothetical protein
VNQVAEGASVACASAKGEAVGAAVGAPVCCGSKFEMDPAGHSSSAVIVNAKVRKVDGELSHQRA